MNRRLLFVITSLIYGGAEAQLVALALGFARAGWQVRVVCMTPLGPRAQDLQSAGVPVDSLQMQPGRPSLRAFLRLVQIIRSFRPSLVHSHMVHANLLARLARPLAQVPVLVCTAHNIREGGRWRETAYRLTDPLCDLTTQVSQAGLRRYLEVGAIAPGRGIFMANGVDTARFKPDAEARVALRQAMGAQESFVWLAVGRFTQAKDYPSLLRAFAEVTQSNPQARLWLVGQGELLEPMRQLAHSLGLAERVQFLGARKDVPALMNAADAYVMSSAWEGMPMVLLEAAAVGLPILATDVGGNREVVHEGCSGWLVPPQDSGRLARAMQLVTQTSEQERKNMGMAGRALVVAKHDLTRVIQDWEEVYVRLLQQKTGRTAGGD
jgi:glycosyltransferase involved in cell wall biosynthesis